MCRGRGMPGSSTTSSGNKGRSATKPPLTGRAEAVRLYDTGFTTSVRYRLGYRREIRYLDLPCRGGYNPSMELAGKVVVVTGASMGIGEAVAKVFAEKGANLVLLSRDAARAEAARVRIGQDRAIALSCDVRHSEEIDRVLGLTLHHFKRVDVWINNAGHGLLDSVAQMEMQACHDTTCSQPTSSVPCRPCRP